MSRFFGFALSVGLLIPGSTVLAQGDAMTELYGEGVHRYFAGDYTGADLVLSQVIDSGSQDPRAHYFRGLVREMQGGGGVFDFETGATLEASGKRVVNVGQALIRIQGATRTKIEEARRAARVQARQLALSKASSGAMTAPATAVTPAMPSETTAEPAEVDNPFADGLRSDATTEMETQPEPATPDVGNPFGDDPTPAPADAGTTTPDAGGNDPFGGAGGDDPFGGAGSDGAAGGDNPFGGAAGGDDPFGGGATGGDDPFGGNPF